MRVMTFNIRYDEPGDGPNAWPSRRNLAIAAIHRHNPDLLGLQEPLRAQWEELVMALDGYAAFGLVDSREGDVYPHGGFVRTARFEVLDAGLFWLSDTPSVVNSVTWPNDWGARACGWTALRDRLADRALVFACTHLDTNPDSWLPSAKVLHAELDRVGGALPVILVGDFNCAAGSDAHMFLCKEAGYRDAWTEAGHEDEGVITFNGFTPVTRVPDEPESLQVWLERISSPLESFGHYRAHACAHHNFRIDWILMRGPLVCQSASIDVHADRGRLSSDHYPVIADIEWTRGEGALR